MTTGRIGPRRGRAAALAVPFWMGALSTPEALAQTGACCLGNASCVLTDPAGCNTLSGEFLGAGTSCAAVVCTGACCQSDEACTEGSADACATGAFQGAESTCESHCVSPLGTAFTYHGRLMENGLPVTDSIDLKATLWESPFGDGQVGGVLTLSQVEARGGLFAVQLDFGAEAFNGSARHLEIAVRRPHDPTDTAPFTPLSPRQEVTASPYSLQTRGIHVDEAGKVGIGTANPSNPLHVEGEDNLTTFYVTNSDPNSFSSSIIAESSGYGLFARGRYAVYGETSNTSGNGVYGRATATTGSTYGVRGQSASTGGIGVGGNATATSGLNYGVYGGTNSFEGYAGYFIGRSYFSGNVGLGVSAPSYRLHLPNLASSSGRGIANAWNTHSSRRWKENIRTIDDALARVLRLRGVLFNWKAEYGGTPDIGFIAEEAATVLPEIVTCDDNGEDAESMDYSRVTALLVEAIKEQQAQIEALRAELKSIRGNDRDSSLERGAERTIRVESGEDGLSIGAAEVQRPGLRRDKVTPPNHEFE